MSDAQTRQVRLATPDDMGAVVGMLRELAAFEQAPAGALRCTVEAFERDGFGPGALFTCLVAEEAGQVVGFLMLIPTYSSWLARPGLMIHDLYMRPEWRGTGLGRALVARAIALGRERGCGRLDVNVLGWNEARRFYEKQGFVAQPDWVLHRLTLEP
ncbi:GNAT family N-acetyltransferase [Pararhodospirillum oryzae]|nr:GNAT family N-acetyltransferase [Pararhodospirillum oryzae]